MGDLTENFSRYEFACKCGCGFDAIQLAFVKKLQVAKDFLKVHEKDFPFVIDSGCRCEKRNAEIEGKKNSAHLRGWAADIQCPDDHHRWLMVIAFYMAGLNRVEINKPHGYIHVDCDPIKSPELLMVYPL